MFIFISGGGGFGEARTEDYITSPFSPVGGVGWRDEMLFALIRTVRIC